MNKIVGDGENNNYSRNIRGDNIQKLCFKKCQIGIDLNVSQ